MNDELLKKVLADEEFVKSLLELESAEEVQAALKEKGVELTLADIGIIQKALESGSEGELDEADLEQVAGGSITLAAVGAIASIVGAVLSGASLTHSLTRRRW